MGRTLPKVHLKLLKLFCYYEKLQKYQAYHFAQSQLNFENIFQSIHKTLRDRKWLPRIYLISCRVVKLFLTKDFFVRNYSFD